MSTPAPYPHGRPRRLRRDDFTRNLVREHRLSAHDLIYPVFLLEGQGRRESVASMPGVERLSLDLLLPVAEQCVELGIPAIALFPVIDTALKTADGREAWNTKGLVPPPIRRFASCDPFSKMVQARCRTDRAARRATASGSDRCRSHALGCHGS